MSVVLAKGRTIFIADTNVTELPEADELVEIACEAARAVKRLGFKPRVAFMSYSTFGNPMGLRSEKVREAVAMLDEMEVEFEYEGEMPPELALDPEKRANYPFMRLTDSANILVMPAIHSASIATKLVQSLGGATVIGPVLLGLSQVDADRAAVGLGVEDPQHGDDGGLRRAGGRVGGVSATATYAAGRRTVYRRRP
jgi:malate dehydrogenase (oxaloacetate-decarboxylating)(NADP+)